MSRGKPAKNREFDDGYVAGAFDRSYVKDLINELVRRAQPNERVFVPLTLERWEQLLRDFRKQEQVKITPRGLRHTGPSHGFAENKLGLHEIQLRG